jgi:ABC-type microcin C transport system duplicated ATPase subunit YejF
MGLHQLTKKDLLPYRQRMQLIFQDPYAALNPRLTIADALCEPLLRWGIVENKKAALAKAAHLLEQVQLPADSLWRYPHQFSGGQRQRIVIARALAVQPEFVVCDECVSALDVSVQAEVLNLLQDLRASLGLTYLFITHDLGLVRYLCPRVVVLQQGRVVEAGATAAVFTNPQSEYTARLLAAVPKLAG